MHQSMARLADERKKTADILAKGALCVLPLCLQTDTKQTALQNERERFYNRDFFQPHKVRYR